MDPHRRQRRRRVAIALGVVLATVATSLISVSGRKVATSGWSAMWPFLLIGVSLAALALLLVWWGRATLPTAVADDEASSTVVGLPHLPYGARQRGRGVVLEPRFVGRVVAPWMAGICLVLGVFVTATVREVAPAVIFGGLALAMGYLAALARGHRLAMDHVGVWRRGRPRERIAWPDLVRTEHGRPYRSPDGLEQQELILHGRVERRHGADRDRMRLRVGMLSVTTRDLDRLVGWFHTRQQQDPGSPFHRWR